MAGAFVLLAAATVLVGPEAAFATGSGVGADAAAFEPDTQEVALARRAAAALRLDVAGVDLLATPDGPVLLEVNTSPGLKGIETVTGRDVAGAILALASRRLAML